MRRMGAVVLALGFLAGLAGCDPATTGGEGQGGSATELGFHDDLAARGEALADTPEATLRFQADGNVIRGETSIQAGGMLRVEFDPDRGQACRGTFNGQPAWEVLMYYRAIPDGQILFTRVLTGAFPDGAARIEVPRTAEEIELWFLVLDYEGCRAWDSNNGANYRFDVAQPVPVTDVRFSTDWTEETDGDIVQGGIVRVDFDPARLDTCRATNGGGRAWNIFASWRFEPGGQTATAALYQGDYFAGEEAMRRPTINVPPDATSVELWFSNSDNTGCVAWDSDFGANYRFPIVADPGGDEPPYCDGVLSWDGPGGTAPHCYDYRVAENYDARHCEFFVNAFGRGERSLGGEWAEWIEAYASVPPQQGELLGVGLWTRLIEEGVEREQLSFGHEIEPNYWKLGFTNRMGVAGSPLATELAADIAAFAFFIDVRRTTGRVERLWHSAGGANYGIAETFAAPGFVQDVDGGTVEYAADSAPLFGAREACQ